MFLFEPWSPYWLHGCIFAPVVKNSLTYLHTPDAVFPRLQVSLDLCQLVEKHFFDKLRRRFPGAITKNRFTLMYPE